MLGRAALRPLVGSVGSRGLDDSRGPWSTGRRLWGRQGQVVRKLLDPSLGVLALQSDFAATFVAVPKYEEEDLYGES